MSNAVKGLDAEEIEAGFENGGSGLDENEAGVAARRMRIFEDGNGFVELVGEVGKFIKIQGEIIG